MRRLAGLGGLVLVVGVLVVAQLMLPAVAAQRLRDRLAGSGQVVSVDVSAFPAVELLWHQADSVTVRLRRYDSSAAGLAQLLDQTADVGRLTATATQLDTGLLTLRDAVLLKRGATLTASANVTEADLRTALPVLDSVTPVASTGGQLILRGTATLFGVTATVDASVRAMSGALVVQPDVPLGALATIRVFSDPRLRVRTLEASPTATGFSVRATGQLR